MMKLSTLIVFVVLALVTVDATFDFGSPFQWLREIPVDRSFSNGTLNDTTTNLLAPPSYSTTHGYVDLLASPAPSNSTLTNYTSVYHLASAPPSNYGTVSLDDLSLAIGHFQDPVLKLVTEADGSAGFVVFDARQGVPENVSVQAAGELTTAVPSTTGASTSPTTEGPVSTPAPSFPGLLAFLRPYIFGPRAPSTLPATTPVSFRASEPSSTTITVEPRGILVTTRGLGTMPAASTGPLADASTTPSATNYRTPAPAATAATHTWSAAVSTTPRAGTFERLSTAATTDSLEFTVLPTASDNAKTASPSDAPTTTLEGGAAGTAASIFDWALTAHPSRHGVVKLTEGSAAAANVSQPLPSLLSSLVDGVQEDGTTSPLAEDGVQYRHFYDPSHIVRSLR